MGFWGTLGKIGAGIAAPFTGGASLAAIPAIDAIGAVTSGAAKGSRDERLAENQQGLSQGQLAAQMARDKYSSDLAGANAQFGAGLQGAQFDRDGQSRAQKQALLAALLSGLQDANIRPGNPAIAARMPTMTGGLRPSAIAGGRQALLDLLAQPQIAAPTYTPASPYQSPGMPEMDKAGKLENILGAVGLGTSVLGALGTRPEDRRLL